jgi:phosphoglycerate kinase
VLVLGFLFFGYNGLTVMIRFISKISPRQLTGIAIVRVDFNTADSWRMEAIIPTINYISRYADKIVLITHKGRPVAQHTSAGVPPDSSELTKFSVASDARKLSRLLKKKVLFIRYDNFSAIRKAIHGAPSGAIILLENIRFWRGEEDNNPSLARDIASVGDYFVNDAFAVS